MTAPHRFVAIAACLVALCVGGSARAQEVTIPATPVSVHRIDEHFMIGVPFARAINPVTKTNWEGTGVEPDVKVPAEEAQARAEPLARGVSGK